MACQWEVRRLVVAETYFRTRTPHTSFDETTHCIIHSLDPHAPNQLILYTLNLYMLHTALQHCFSSCLCPSPYTLWRRVADYLFEFLGKYTTLITMVVGCIVSQSQVYQ